MRYIVLFPRKGKPGQPMVVYQGKDYSGPPDHVWEGEAFMQSFVLFHISSSNRNLALPLSKHSRIRINPQNLFSFLASHPLATNQIVEKGETQLTMVQGLQRDLSHDPEPARWPHSQEGFLLFSECACADTPACAHTHPPYCPEINHRWNPHHIGKCKPVLHPGSGLFTVGVASDLASIHSDWLMLMPYLLAKYFLYQP